MATTSFHLNEEELQSSLAADGGETSSNMMMDKIPILKRRAQQQQAAAASNESDNNNNRKSENNIKAKDPICVIVVGMAGSGKTTLMAQLQKSLNLKARNNASDAGDSSSSDKKVSTTNPSNDNSRAGYAINLDPAAKYVPFTSSIDIRDTVDYIEVMKQHKLGPNGAILTCLNLFATKFDQVMDILERRAFGEEEEEEEGDNQHDVTDDKMVGKSEDGGLEETKPAAKADSNNAESTHSESSSSSPLDYILIDTPGQIEAFTWSASGSIVTSALATTFPTVLAFVIDTPRCAASVHTFMSNMLYACSMLYRAKLPMVVVLNKTDVVGCEFIKEWMDDYESFQEALDDASSTTNGYSDEMAGGGGGSGYYSSLTRSLSLVLDEFYNHLHKVGVSAATGDGVDEFWTVVQQAALDYEDGYLVDLKCRMEEQMAKEHAMKRVSARRLARDLEEEE